VEAAECLDYVFARTDVQMVRVAENHLDTGSAEVERGERLYRSLRANRHEGRRLHDAVRERETPGAGGTGMSIEVEVEHGAKAKGGKREKGKEKGKTPS
jgi:hypothetical protein